MKIKNDTNLRTDQLQKLIYRVAQDELDPGQLKGRGHVHIKYQKKNTRQLGCCYYGTARHPRVLMTLAIPRIMPVDTIQLAKVIAHEFGHAKGIRHKDMKNVRYGWVDGWRERYAWAKDFHVEEAQAKPKPSGLQLVLTKAAKVDKKVIEWERAIKRGETMLRKWKTKQKYYERRAAAMQSEKETTDDVRDSQSE